MAFRSELEAPAEVGEYLAPMASEGSWKLPPLFVLFAGGEGGLAAEGEFAAELGEGAGGSGFAALVEDTEESGGFFFEVVEGFAGGGG